MDAIDIFVVVNCKGRGAFQVAESRTWYCKNQIIGTSTQATHIVAPPVQFIAVTARLVNSTQTHRPSNKVAPPPPLPPSPLLKTETQEQ